MRKMELHHRRITSPCLPGIITDPTRFAFASQPQYCASLRIIVIHFQIIFVWVCFTKKKSDLLIDHLGFEVTRNLHMYSTGFIPMASQSNLSHCAWLYALLNFFNCTSSWTGSNSCFSSAMWRPKSILTVSSSVEGSLNLNVDLLR